MFSLELRFDTFWLVFFFFKPSSEHFDWTKDPHPPTSRAGSGSKGVELKIPEISNSKNRRYVSSKFIILLGHPKMNWIWFLTAIGNGIVTGKSRCGNIHRVGQFHFGRKKVQNVASLLIIPSVGSVDFLELCCNCQCNPQLAGEKSERVREMGVCGVEGDGTCTSSKGRKVYLEGNLSKLSLQEKCG